MLGMGKVFSLQKRLCIDLYASTVYALPKSFLCGSTHGSKEVDDKKDDARIV